MARQPTPPPAPDPREIAQTDAEFNRIDQFTPFGSLTFSGPSRNVATQEFSPELQENFNLRTESDTNLLRQALERQQGLNPNPIDLSQFGNIQSEIDTSGINFSDGNFGPQLQAPNLQQLGRGPQFQGQVQGADIQGQVDTGLDLSGLPGIPQDIEQFRGDVQQSLFDRGRSLLDPVFQDQERALEQRLANQGLPSSGQAVDRDLTRFGDSRNRAFTDLANQSVIGAGNAAQQQLGNLLAARGQGFGEQVTGANLNLAGGNFANNAAGQQFGQNLAQGNFTNNALQQGFQNEQTQAGFNNQTGLLGLGAEQSIRDQQGREAQLGNQASAQNLGLQQTLLNNRNSARAQSLAEQQGIRGNQFNELASLLGLQQVQAPGLSSFFAPGQADVGGAFALNQQAQQNAFNAQSNQAGAFNSGLFGLGGALLGGPLGGALSSAIGGGGAGGAPPGGGSFFSDRRLKRNIKRIGTKKGHKWYSFDYIWGEKSEGVMSDEVPERFVRKYITGFDAVDYGALGLANA